MPQKCCTYLNFKKSECNYVFVGQTVRDFETGYKKHYRSFKLNQCNRTCANYVIEGNHTYPEIYQLKILHRYIGYNLKLLKALKIQITFKNKFISLTNQCSVLSIGLRLYPPPQTPFVTGNSHNC